MVRADIHTKGLCPNQRISELKHFAFKINSAKTKKAKTSGGTPDWSNYRKSPNNEALEILAFMEIDIGWRFLMVGA